MVLARRGGGSTTATPTPFFSVFTRNTLSSGATVSFFSAIFSVVTQFDVCAVGWYNCRMEFFGKDRGTLVRMVLRRVNGCRKRMNV